MKIKTVKSAYENHKGRAKNSNIGFSLTFDQWKNIWEKALGPNWFEKRGTKSHNYCMARNKDKGPYKIGNVSIKTMSENSREAHLGKPKSKKHCENIRKTKLGIKLSLETRKKMSLSRIGNKNSLGFRHSEKTKSLWSKQRKGKTSNKGYKHTEEWKVAASKRHKGNNYTLGRKISKAHIAALRAGHKRHFDKLRNAA